MNEFHLADFFPVASWHNQNLAPNNLALVGDVTVVSVRRTELYVSGGLDDVNARAFGISDSDVPTVYALALGGSYYGRAGSEVACRRGGNAVRREYRPRAVSR